jgi:serine/threonine protein kinase/tetratricopeptide (TPR) repeat protein
LAADSSTSAAPPDDPVEALLAEVLERPAGERRSALSELVEAHPDHAAALRARVAVLESLGVLDADGDEPFPEELGDFHLLRRLGGGGMGVVYLAEQRSLSRPVALKLIRPADLYFPRARERFRREVEAIAALEHPGIVPIHAVGEEQGIPFFAMQRVEGASLGEVVADLSGRAPESLTGSDIADAVRGHLDPDSDAPVDDSAFAGSYPVAVARILRQVAAALHHAHERGILHRDVKPSNILLAPDGRALLVDFGLTREEGDGSLTASGSPVGTLHYMAPEQVKGSRQLDRRVDVYALGVTLHELLTLQTPFAGVDRTSTEQAILQGRVDPVRVRNRGVPGDLATVCSKAMDWLPAGRYPTAGELGDDLLAVVEGRPVAARPPSALERLLRGARRRPALAAGVLAAALALVALFVVLQREADFQKREAAQSKQLADEQTLRAEQSEQLASEQRLRAEEQTRFAVEQERLAGELADALTRAETDLLTADAMVALLSDVLAAAGPEVALGQALTADEILARGVERLRVGLAGQPVAEARLLTTVGLVTDQIGRPAEAVELLRQAVDRWDDAAATAPLTERNQFDRAGSMRNLSRALHHTGRLQEALEVGRAALADHEGHVGAHHPITSRMRSELAMLVDEDHPGAEEAVALMQRAVDDVRGQPGADPDLVADFEAALGSLLVSRGELDRGRPLLAAWVERVRGGRGEVHPMLAKALIGLGLALKMEGRFDDAESAYREALDVLAVLHKGDHPETAGTLLNLATLLHQTGRGQEGEDMYKQALAMCRRSLPPEHDVRLTVTGNLAGLYLEQGRMDEAEELLTELAPGLDLRYPNGHPMVGHTRARLAMLAAWRGDGSASGENADLAVAAFEAMEALTDAGITRYRVAQALLGAGAAEEAARQARGCIEVFEALGAEPSDLHGAWTLLHDALVASGQDAAAAAAERDRLAGLMATGS